MNEHEKTTPLLGRCLFFVVFFVSLFIWGIEEAVISFPITFLVLVIVEIIKEFKKQKRCGEMKIIDIHNHKKERQVVEEVINARFDESIPDAPMLCYKCNREATITIDDREYRDKYLDPKDSFEVKCPECGSLFKICCRYKSIAVVEYLRQSLKYKNEQLANSTQPDIIVSSDNMNDFQNKLTQEVNEFYKKIEKLAKDNGLSPELVYLNELKTGSAIISALEMRFVKK